MNIPLVIKNWTAFVRLALKQGALPESSLLPPSREIVSSGVLDAIFSLL